jgi:hypothetical protein
MSKGATEYKYAVRGTAGYSKDKYVTRLSSYGQFSWSNGEALDAALLFDSASQAESKTAEGRAATASYGWVVVPVKVTGTTKVVTEAVITRELV